MKLEVRCCCQPHKLLGWLEVPDHLAKLGEVIVFPVHVTVDPDGGLRDHARPQRQIALPVAEIVIPTDFVGPGPLESFFDRHLALKSEETPLEVLRGVRGFEEAPGPA